MCVFSASAPGGPQTGVAAGTEDTSSSAPRVHLGAAASAQHGGPANAACGPAVGPDRGAAGVPGVDVATPAHSAPAPSDKAPGQPTPAMVGVLLTTMHGSGGSNSSIAVTEQWLQCAEKRNLD